MHDKLEVIKSIIFQHEKLLRQGFDDEEYRMLYYNLIEQLGDVLRKDSECTPEKDANESESHFCNSLNAMYGTFLHLAYQFKDSQYCIVDTKLAKLASKYFERAQECITYLRKKVSESESRKVNEEQEDKQ